MLNYVFNSCTFVVKVTLYSTKLGKLIIIYNIQYVAFYVLITYICFLLTFQHIGQHPGDLPSTRSHHAAQVVRGNYHAPSLLRQDQHPTSLPGQNHHGPIQHLENLKLPEEGSHSGLLHHHRVSQNQVSCSRPNPIKPDHFCFRLYQTKPNQSQSLFLQIVADQS